MLARLSEVTAELRAAPPPLPADEIAEAIQFLQWIAADNFTLLGARDYAYTDSEQALEPRFDTGLGLLRSPEMRLLLRGDQLVTATPEIREFLNEPKLIVMTKAAQRSRVHRRVDLDYIGVKHFDRDGKLVGEWRFCGLLTSTAYTRSVRAIPYLRRKVDSIVERAGFDPNSHSGKALVNVLENYPRDELFQIDEDTLYQFALAILQLDERPRVRVLPRYDRFDRFVSVLVYVPRERYDSQIRARIGDYLAGVFNGRVRAFYPFFPEGRLVRVHFIIARDEGATPKVDRASLDRAVEAIVRSWTDDIEEALAAAHEPKQARALLARYRDAFPIDYREVYPPATAIADIGAIEALTAERPLAVEFYREAGMEPSCAGLKVFSASRPIPLSERVPVLENMGFSVVDERTYHIRPQGAADVWFHDMTIESASRQPFDVAALRERLEACVLAVARGQAESDGYNALVLVAGLPGATWCSYARFRASCGRFESPIRRTICGRRCASMPASRRRSSACSIRASIRICAHRRTNAPRARLSSPPRSKTPCNRSRASTRTASSAASSMRCRRRCAPISINAIVTAGPKSLSRSSSRAASSTTCRCRGRSTRSSSTRRGSKAVHLRFGKVARGGIRWSDRPQDFRTEILGLVKAQNVKNAVIVPVGAKGGFVPKRLPAGGARDAVQAEGTEAYKLFISTLLDITDNIGPGRWASCRRPTSCAMTATILISWSPPTKARRRSPTSPTTSPMRTTSGWAMPSPPAARPATTTRRWASPRAAPGNP